MSTSAHTIHKFGGVSLTDGAAVRHVASIVAGLQDRRVVVTPSAMAGVTNELFDIALRAAAGEADASIHRLDALRDRHAGAWRTACDGAPLPPASVAACDVATQLIRSVGDAHALTPRTLDAIVALGEQLSAQLLAGAIRAAGADAEYVDATAVIQTDGRAGAAVPDLRATAEPVRAAVGPLLARGAVPVVPGYIGAAPDGATVTLGRGGADLTATTLAAVLGAAEVVLWKDVPGILTADPRVVPDARVIPELHVREAAELAYYGAKVLHPRALIPLRGRECVVRVKPFTEPSAAGTRISTEYDGGREPVRALSALAGQSIVAVSGSGMAGVPGVVARTFAALQRAGISVSIISQASSEHTLSLGMAADQAGPARDQLAAEFAGEIARGEIEGIELRPATATLSVVGLGMAGQPGIAARLFTALGKCGINIVAIAQGSSEINISVVLDANDAATAQRAIHDEFQLGKIGGGRPAYRPGAHRADVILLGFGLIGRALADMLVASEQGGARATRLVGVIDRSGYVFDPAGLTADRVAALATAKRDGRPLAFADGAVSGDAGAALTHMFAHALTRPILVDVTANETAPILQAAVTAGADIVLANKRPVGGDRAQAEALRVAARRHGRRILHEATVGAGLPILDTFAKLVEAGDTVRMIEGCPSGTMGYLFGEMGRGTTFSEALRGAMRLGYTEPDPRDDLSGADVARKGLILGRLLGFEGEFRDVRVESLVPVDAVALPLDEFLARLDTYDAAWAERVEEARARGTVLRYRATATRDAVSVGLVEVAAGSALGALGGTDNQFSFTTDRYDTNPLVITGPGAGPAVTAAGVLNDVLKLAGALA